MNCRRLCTGIAALVGVLALSPAAPAADRMVSLIPGTQPATQPATRPVMAPTTRLTTRPATRPAVEMSPAAKAELDQLRTAYAKVKTLHLTGRLAVNFDFLGQTDAHQADFTALFNAPNQFRHEIKDEIVVGSTGEKAYAYVLEDQQYLQADAPKDREKDPWPRFVQSILAEQNPGLLLAMAGNSADALTAGGTRLEKLDDATIDQKPYTVLALQTPAGEQRFWIDPDTHLLRRLRMDMRKMLEGRGVEARDIKTAEMTFDYPAVTAGAPVKDAAFAWAPPPGARDVAEMSAADDEEPAAELENKPAPAFTLSDLAGNEVKLADLKGSVVVLAFWATWDPACVRGMPTLDKVAREMAARGVKVFAVNIEQDKSTPAAFVKEKGLTVPILLDPEASVAADYKADAIPQTVIIDKAGVVRKVLVGLHAEEDLKAEIEKAMK